MIAQKRHTLHKFAFCSDSSHIENFLREYFQTGPDEVIDKLYEKFEAYVLPFWEAGPFNVQRNKYDYDEQLRSIFNKIRDQFMHLCVRAIDKSKNVSFWRRHEFDIMFTNSWRIVKQSNYNRAIVIYNDCLANARKNVWWSKEMEFSLLDEISSLQDIKEAITTYDNDDSICQISINNKYLLKCETLDSYNYNIACLHKMYETYLAHGHVMSTANL
jgi:hypothetical protein